MEPVSDQQNNSPSEHYQEKLKNAADYLEDGKEAIRLAIKSLMEIPSGVVLEDYDFARAAILSAAGTHIDEVVQDINLELSALAEEDEELELSIRFETQNNEAGEN